MDLHAESHLQAEATTPAPLWAIALAGMTPFPAAALVHLYGPADLRAGALTLLLTWSAIMLGFLGGIRWGLESGRAQPRWTRLAQSVISPIAGWSLLFARDSLETAWMLGGLIAAFILQWLYDHTASEVPARSPRLMTVLTLGACLSLSLVLEQALRL